MKTSNFVVEKTINLTPADAAIVNGGDFAYDSGFFIREFFIYTKNGGWFGGTGAVATDLVLRYRPLL